MSMLPFATKTDLYEALRLADCKLADVEVFLDMLKAEHNTPAARIELKNLWTKYLQVKYGIAPPEAQGAAPAPAPSSKALTPPASPRAESERPAGEL